MSIVTFIAITIYIFAPTCVGLYMLGRYNGVLEGAYRSIYKPEDAEWEVALVEADVRKKKEDLYGALGK